MLGDSPILMAGDEYALAMRMGLIRSEHIRAGLIEFGGLVVVGAIAAQRTAANADVAELLRDGD